ncbi:MAG: hypothetical protein MI810_06210 [Flavobacteriales bacterium]|nr:hypothetical protein [Flavobacteriales bacterium]
MITVLSFLAFKASQETDEEIVFETSEADLKYGQYSWKLFWVEGDSVIITSSIRYKDGLERKNNHHFYGRVIASDAYDYEFVPSFEFYAEGCQKPSYEYLNSDSIQIDFDPIMQEKLKGWTLDIESKTGFSYHTKLDGKPIVLKIQDVGKSVNKIPYQMSFQSPFPNDLKSFKLIGGYNCATYISAFKITDRKYYLNKTEKGVKVIQLLRPHPNKEYGDCDYCKKEFMLYPVSN